MLVGCIYVGYWITWFAACLAGFGVVSYVFCAVMIAGAFCVLLDVWLVLFGGAMRLWGFRLLVAFDCVGWCR